MPSTLGLAPLKASPSLNLQIHDAIGNDITNASVDAGATGISVRANAVVSGGLMAAPATGTVTYRFYNDDACAGPSSDQTVNPGSPSQQIKLLAGAYSYLAEYSGDSNYTPVSTSCKPITITLSISGKVFNDFTHNGFSSDDAGVSGWVVLGLYTDKAGALTPTGQWTSTWARHPEYRFTGLIALPAGATYAVRELTPFGSLLTASRGPAASTAGYDPRIGVDSKGNDFDHFTPGQICGSDYKDYRGLAFDPPPKLSTRLPDYVSIEVDLYSKPNGVLVAKTFTDNNGDYCFRGLDYGTYYVQEVVPPGWVQTGARGKAASSTMGLTSSTISLGNDFVNAHIGGKGDPQTMDYQANAGLAAVTASDISFLNTVNLRNQDGGLFRLSGTLSQERSQLSSFLEGSDSANPANVLSAQLITIGLNVRHGGVGSGAPVYVPGLAAYADTLNATPSDGGIGNPGYFYNQAFMFLKNLLIIVNNELARAPSPRPATLDYDLEGALANALDQANNNLNYLI